MTKLSGQADKVLEALARGRSFRRTQAGWLAGTLRAPASLVDELGRAALVRVGPDRLALTEAGRARAARRALRPIRLLAERGVPDETLSGERGPKAKAASRARRSVTVNLMESPLGWLRARGLIDQRQFDAGERLRGDWTIAGLGPRVTMRWDAAPTGGNRHGADAPLDPTLAGIAAKRRFEGAISSAGKGLGDVLWRVVCAGEGLEPAEAALGWPRRTGKVVLLMALDRVADYYGIA